MFSDQTHSRAVAIVITPDPPVALKEVGALETVDWHFSTLGPTSEAWDDVQADANPKKRRLAPHRVPWVPPKEAFGQARIQYSRW